MEDMTPKQILFNLAIVGRDPDWRYVSKRASVAYNSENGRHGSKRNTYYMQFPNLFGYLI